MSASRVSFSFGLDCKSLKESLQETEVQLRLIQAHNDFRRAALRGDMAAMTDARDTEYTFRDLLGALR